MKVSQRRSSEDLFRVGLTVWNSVGMAVSSVRNTFAAMRRTGREREHCAEEKREKSGVRRKNFIRVELLRGVRLIPAHLHLFPGTCGSQSSRATRVDWLPAKTPSDRISEFRHSATLAQ